MEYLEIKGAEIKKVEIAGNPALIVEPKTDEVVNTIVFYHGWGSCKENQIFRANIFASYGYRVILPDAQFHGERIQEEIDYEDEKVSANLLLRVIMHSIEESPSIFNYIKENYPGSEIAVAGHSMGAITAGGLYGFKKDLKMAFIYNGINNWEAMVKWLNNIRDEKSTKYEVFRVDEFFLDMDPMNAGYLFKDRPMVLYNGAEDKVIDPEGQHSFVEKISCEYEKQELLEFKKFEDVPHQISTDMLEESIKFAKEVAKF
ncbi:alpha/beta hydrolase [Peptoniphilus sp. MSJ-1]|uniref:Alpha/beta hydrolase n=1 Tax=Peptoniphilus ovalis TaxID=2841503 RepID=A0ABS6FE77_9FIRM|nr:alpha/beta hydrolase [Peptoniphilus ovalis]MBU5668269.1 alpha/beta hydrolase [Peptoniphilus ovalis]